MITKFITITVVLFFTLIAIWFFNITTFNPITRSDAINASKSIVDKVRQYESKHPLSEGDIKVYYQFIDLSKEEHSLIRKYGLDINKVGNGYEVTITLGFDSYVFYRTEGDCWYQYGNKTIVGLNICAEN